MLSKQVLALQFRPKTFEELVGQDSLIKAIRGHYAQGRMPNAWMFNGETGAGKTTIARIMATSLQCRHSKKFGSPCDKCLKKTHKFNITEINASRVTTIESLTAALDGYDFTPSPGSRRRIYILDEAQRISKPAQNLLLKYFEDCPKTTVWFVCTTDSDKILKAIRRRCTIYTVSSLDMAGIKTLVKRAMDYIECERSVGDLVEALWSSGITSSGLVVNAVEKYAAGNSPEASVRVEGTSTDFDTSVICHAAIKGNLEKVMQQMKEAKPEDARAVRISVSNYLKAILLEETAINERSKAVADSINDLLVDPHQDSMQIPATVAALYKLCARFSKYAR